MRVLVTGGTGFVGSHLCNELAERGHEVTAFARQSDGENLSEAVEFTAGDVTEPTRLETAFEGQDAVVNLVAVTPLKQPRGGNKMHERVHLNGTENVVQAAEATNVDRLVQMSSILADPKGPTAYLRAKGAAEDVVRESSLDWVILRPTVVFGDGCEFIPFIKTVAPPYVTPLPGGGKTRFQVIWIGDIAPMIADTCFDDKHVGETYEIGGPDELTLAEVAKLIHRSDGRGSTVVPIPMALAKIGMTVGGMIPGFPFGPDQYRSLKLDLVTQQNSVEAFGTTPPQLRSFTDYLGLN